MTSLDSIRRFRATILLAIACGIVGAGAAFAVANALPKVYEARASLVAASMADTFAELADSRSVLEKVTTDLNLPETVETLAGRVSGDASKTSNVLTVIVHDPDPSQAAAIANAIAAELVTLAPGITGYSSDAQAAIKAGLASAQSEITRTEAEIAALAAKTDPTVADRALLTTLEGQLATVLGVRSGLLSLQLSYAPTAISVVGEAAPPTRASSPQVASAIAFGGAVGIAIGTLVGLLILYLNGRDETEVPPAVVAQTFGRAGNPRG